MDTNNNNGHGVISAYEILLRAMVFCVTLRATLLTSVNDETYTFEIALYSWILKISNGMVCLYLGGSAILSVIYRIKKVRTEDPIFLLFDILMSALLCSCATTVALNPRSVWDIVGYSILRTYLGYILFQCLVYVSTLSHPKNLYKSNAGTQLPK